MEKTLRKIANLLILNLQNIDNLGLMNGKMGVALFLYCYARHSSQPAYNDQADDLLDELFAALRLNLPHSLVNGLSGIGIGLNHLIQNRFIETDESPDELFKDVDIRLSQDLSGQLMSDMRNTFPVFSSGFYILSRIETGKRTLRKNKLISLSLTGIHTIYTNEKHGISPVFTNSVIHFLTGIYHHGIYKEQTKKTLKAVLTFILDHALTTDYYPADIDILRHLLSSVEVNIELTNKILAQINQYCIIPETNVNMEVVCQNIQQYMLYPNLDYPHFSTLPIEKQVDDCITESSQSGLSLLPYIGLNIMRLKLC